MAAVTGEREQMAAQTGIDPNAFRQGLISGGDITSMSTNEALVQAELDYWQEQLAAVDQTVQPIKAFLIKQKVAELNARLQTLAEGVGATSAAVAREQSNALAGQLNVAAGADTRPGSTDAMGDYFTGPMDFNEYTGTYGPRGQAIAELAYAIGSPTLGERTYIAGPRAEARTPRGYTPPSYMAPWLTGTGSVRPLGAQTQVGALQQAALWEQEAATRAGVKSIEDYLDKVEPYINVIGEEHRAKSAALKPKEYGYKSLWERALQR